MAAAAACLFVSGVASLILEVAWTRELHLAFGSTTLAASTVLVAYMLGLGFGGLAAGRIAPRLARGLVAYGRLEAGIGLYALAVPALLALMPGLDRGLLAGLAFWPAALARFAIVLSVLLVPTMMMGATLPVLVHAVVGSRTDRAAGSTGLLYGVNTLGAVAGAFASTFVLFGALGLRGTSIAGALLDLAVGAVVVFLLAPRMQGIPATGEPALPEGRERAASGRGIAVASYGIVGLTALVYEISWTRVLALVIGSSIYAFATMLATFLGGIALGSLAARRFGDRVSDPMAAYAWGIAALGLSSLVAMLLVPSLPGFLVALAWRMGLSPSATVAASVLVSALLMLAPTLVLGGLFPLLCRAAVRGGEDLAAVVGRVYFANTIGSAAGAFAAGFVLVPKLGLQRTMMVAVAVDLVLAALLLLSRSRSSRTLVASAVLAAATALVFLVPPAWAPEALTRGAYMDLPRDFDVGIRPLPLDGIPDEELLFYRDGINATVSVHRGWGERYLHINGKGEAGTGAAAMSTQVLAGEIPMLFGAKAERVLVVGLASGVTAGSAALHRPGRMDVVELEPAVIEASHFFDDVNNRPLAQRFTRTIADDGRIHVARSQAEYDVVISEPSNPWVSGSASLFTREYFHDARAALAPGGRFLQWLQLYEIEPAAFASILAALRAEFPFVYGFADRQGGNDVFLLAADHPLGPGDLPRWDRLDERVRDDLRRVNVFSTADLWSLLRISPASIDSLASAAPAANSDDNMLVELRSPRALGDPTALPANWDRVPPLDPSLVTLAASDGPLLGELALSFVAVRSDPKAARGVLDLAASRGAASASGLVAESEVARQATPAKEAEAAALLDRAVASSPDSFLPRYFRARALYASERYDAALGDVALALAASPGDLRARYLRLQALAALGRFRDAEGDADALLGSPMLQLDPQVRVYAAHTKAGLGKFDDAIDQLLEYLHWVPFSAVEWPVLAQMYQAAGRPDEAATARQNAEKAARNRVLTLHRQALQNERAGAIAGAVDLLRQALAEDPDYEPARRDLARLGGSAG